MTGEKDAPADHIPDTGKMVAAPAEMPGVEESVAKAMAERRLELIDEPLVRIWGELAATAIAVVRAHQFVHGQTAEAALAAERERCAKIAESAKSYDDNLQRSAGCATTGQRIAAAIRGG